MFYRICFLILTTVFFVQACGFKPRPENSCHFVQNSLDQRVSWNSQVPIVIYIHESVPVQYRDAIDMAIEDWRYALGTQLFKIGGVIGGPNKPAQDGYSVVYWETEWDSKRTFEQGQTTIHWAGTQIFEADMKINDKDFDYSRIATGEADKVDVESLFVHELGHVLGLAHVQESNSVMASVLNEGKVRRQPTKIDVDDIRCEY